MIGERYRTIIQKGMVKEKLYFLNALATAYLDFSILSRDMYEGAVIRFVDFLDHRECFLPGLQNLNANDECVI